MWNFLVKLFGGGISAVVDSSTSLVKTIWGDRSAKDAAVALEQHDVLTQFAAEFVARQQRTWWDSLVDGVNRLPRPALVIGVHATFIWAAWDPVNFTICMQALQVVPDALWAVWLTIVAFYFGGRIIENAPKTWKTEPRTLDLAKEIIRSRSELRASPAPAVVDQDTLAVPTVDNSTIADRAVAATIWGEARGESHEGRVAVAWVIHNRVNSPGWWGRDWISVCTAKWQFSCWWDSQAKRVRSIDERDERFSECLVIAREVMDGNIADPTGGATHYYADTIAPPKWAIGKTPTAVIGHHRFYRIGLTG